MNLKSAITAALAGVLALAATAAAEPSERLPALAADVSQTSVSGISSGAYMAGQFHLAHARIVVGAAIIAGGPYGCAETAAADAFWMPGTAMLNLSQAVNACMMTTMSGLGIPDADTLLSRARKLAADGSIGPLADVTKARVYLFTGTHDVLVAPAIVAKAAEFYQRLGLPASNIRFVTDVPAGHAFVTRTEGAACELSAPPYVAHCGYDQAGELLAHIYGSLASPSSQDAGRYLGFDQREFTAGLGDHGMADSGTVYIPPACEQSSGGCRIHVAFHGCAQNRAAAGDAFIKGSGLARWADTNRLIVLFPEAAASYVNVQGCWDWWGYTGADFLTRKAPQIAAVRRMLERLSAH